MFCLTLCIIFLLKFMCVCEFSVHVFCIMFACSLAQPARGLFGWSEGQHCQHTAHWLIKYSLLPLLGQVSSLHSQYLKSWLLLFLKVAVMVCGLQRGREAAFPQSRKQAQCRSLAPARLIQQLSPALARLVPPPGDSPVKHAQNLRSTRCTN